MKRLRTALRNATKWAGKTAVEKIANLAIGGVFAFFLATAANNWLADKGVAVPIVIGCALAVAIRVVSLAVETVQSQVGKDPASCCAHIAAGSGVSFVVGLESPGDIPRTRMTEDTEQCTFAADSSLTAVSTDGTLAATAHGAHLRICLIDPMTGAVIEWAEARPARPPQRVLAVEHNGDRSVWCAISVPELVRLKIDASGRVHETAVRRAADEFAQAFQASQAAFLGDQLLAIRDNGNLHRIGPDGEAREIMDLGRITAMDAALVAGESFLAVARRENGQVDSPRLSVYRLDRSDPTGLRLVGDRKLDKAPLLVRITRSPMAPRTMLYVATVSDETTTWHQFEPSATAASST